MADKFSVGDNLKARWKPAHVAEHHQIDVTVVEQPEPGQYRCQTNMGTVITFQEADLERA